jgi:hypothetical protein
MFEDFNLQNDQKKKTFYNYFKYDILMEKMIDRLKRK